MTYILGFLILVLVLTRLIDAISNVKIGSTEVH